MRLLVAVVCAFLWTSETAWGRSLREAFPKTDLYREIQFTQAELRGSREFFTHARELRVALEENLPSFAVHETVHTTGALNLNEYLEKNPGGNEFDTKTVYTLAPETLAANVVDLDAARHDSAIRELSHESVTHCAGTKDFFTGRILIGSSEGQWYSSEEVQSRLLSGSAGLLPKHETKPTLVLIRRVVSVGAHPSLGAECLLVKTESLSSLELFDEIHITSLASHPFSTTYFNEIPTAEDEQTAERADEQTRKLQLTMGYGNVRADPPLISCQASYWQAGSYSIGKSQSYALGLTSGCVEYNTLTPGFNMNYNTKLHSAINDKIDLSNGFGAGMSCESCYAFLGNSFLAIINYKLKGMQLSFEVKINGGAGVNLDVAMKNPSISATWSKQLLSPQTSFSTITLGAGLALTYKFGGLLAEVSGSGSAAGEAIMRGGATGDLQMGAIYDGSTMYAQSNNFGSFTKPYYNGGFSSFRTGRFAANVNLKAQTDFGVSLGSLFSASGDVSIVGNLGLDYSLGATSTLTASLLATSTASRQLSADVASTVFTPGSIVPIRIEYTGFNPDEDLVLAYSFVTPSGNEYRVMSREMRSHSSGTGHFETHWQVPFDARFTGKGKAHINVRCSNLLSRTSSTAPFDVNINSDKQSIFSTPRGEDRLPLDVPVRVRWNKDLLAYFKGRSDSMIRGDRNQADHVVFRLHGQKLHPDGGVEKEMNWALQLNSTVQNTGDAHIIFPSAKAKGFDRFYLSIHHAEADSVSGSNDGFFYLGPRDNAAPATAVQSVTTPRFVVSPTSGGKKFHGVPEEEDRRELNSCGANKIQVTMKAQYSGGITNVRVKLLGNLPSWTGDWPVANLMAPYLLCFSPPVAKTTGGPGITSIANPSCTVPSVGSGKCQDSAWACNGGQYYSGYCSGGSNIKCCVATSSSSSPPKNTAPLCNVPTAGAGTCIATTYCKGYYYSGYCSGANNIKCCIV